MVEFQPSAITRVSSACTAICLWVRAMYTYYKVKLAVEPKRLLAATAQAEFDVGFTSASASTAFSDTHNNPSP